MRRLSAILIVLIITSCVNDKKRNTINPHLQLIKFIPSTISQLTLNKEEHINSGKETCVYVYFKNKKLNILSAYIDCDMKSQQYIDTTERKIGNCNQKLFIENDTVKICFIPELKGKAYSHKVSVIVSNENKNFFVADTSFSFVAE